MASAKGIRAGGAYVELFTRDGMLVRGLRSAQARLNAFAASISSVGQRLFGAGILLGAPLAAAGRMFAEMGSDMLDMSQRTGLTVEALSELKFAAEQSGASVEDLEVAIKQMSRMVAGAEGEVRGAQGVLERLGLSAERLANLSQDERFEMIGQAISSIPDPAVRAARAIEIFGRGGTRMLPMLNEGANGIRRLREEANRLGITMSTQDAVAAEAFGDTMSAMTAVLKRAAFNIGSALAPSMKELSELITRAAVSASKWIRENAGIVRLIDRAVIVLTGMGIALMVLGPAMRVVSAGIGVLAFAFTTLGTVFAAVKALAILMWTSIAGPIGLIAAAAVTATVAIAAHATATSGILGSLGQAFRGLSTIATQTWSGISDALAGNDWALAAQIAWTGVQLAWQSGTMLLKAMWRGFIAGADNAWINFTGGIAEVWHKTTSLLAQGLVAVAKTMVIVMQGAFEAIAGAAGALGLQMDNPFQGAANQLDQIGENIAQEDARAAQQRAQQRAAQLQANIAAAGVPDDADLIELKRLRNELESLRAQAQWSRALTEGVGDASGRRPQTDMPGMREKIEARGTFSAFAISGLGASSVTDRIARATEETARNTRDNAQPTVT